MEKIKPYLLPGLLVFYLVFSVGMIPIGYLVNRVGTARVAHFLFAAGLVVLASQWLLATIWATFGPGKFLQRLIPCFLCALLALLAFEQTRCLMFWGSSRWDHYGSLVDSWKETIRDDSGTFGLALLLAQWLFLVMMLCVLRLIPGLRWRVGTSGSVEPLALPPSRRTSRLRLLCISVTAGGTWIMVNTGLFSNGVFWVIQHFIETLQRGVGPNVLYIAPFWLAVFTPILMSMTLSRFADWLLYRRKWLLIPVLPATIAATVACCYYAVGGGSEDNFRRTWEPFVSVMTLLGLLLTTWTLGLAGYRLRSRKNADDAGTAIDPGATPAGTIDSRFLSWLTSLEKMAVISLLALLIVTIPTGFRKKLVTETWARRIDFNDSGEITGIAAWQGGTVSSFSFLKGNNKLTLLGLEDARVSEAGMRSLQGLNSSLQGGLELLFLGGCEFNAQDLMHLENFTSLRLIELSATPTTDASLVHLKGLKNMEKLRLNSTSLTGDGLKHLKDLTNLQQLDLYGTPITDAAVKHLTELTQLQTLDVAKTRFSPTGMAMLHKNFRGQIVDTLTYTLGILEQPKLAEILAPRNQDGHIETLNLTGRKAYFGAVIDDRMFGTVLIMLKYAKQLPHLKALNLGNTGMMDDYMRYLAELPQLDYLDISHGEITGFGLAELRTLSQLKTLTLNGTQITDADLPLLVDLTKLEILGLSATSVSDMGLEHLKELPHLRALSLSGTEVTDAGLLKLSEEIDSLELQDTQISDQGLEHLKRLKKLQYLDLRGTQVTDAGLTNLKELTDLLLMQLGNTKVTAAGIAELKKALPDCEIEQH